MGVTFQRDNIMFCPNCGKENQPDQKFCRSCGLNLNAISQVVAELWPSEENAVLQRRKRILEKFGFAALAIAGLIGLMSLIFAAALYKLILFGPEFMFWASAIALMVFLMVAAVLIGYSKLFMRFEKVNPQLAHLDESPSIPTTGKLLEDRFFEPVPSVTEHSTELLPRRDNRHRS